MRYCVLLALFFISIPVSAQNIPDAQVVTQEKKTLIRNIDIEGFVLQDKGQFLKLFKPYRQKHLSKSDMDTILQEIKDIYEREGYQQLVAISYKVSKNRLVFTASMIN